VTAVLLGLMTALIAVGTSWYNRQKAYINIVRIRIFLSSLTAVIAVLMGLAGFYFGMLFAQVVATTLVATLVLYSLRSLLTGWRSYTFMIVAKEHSGAPKYLLPAALLDVLTLQLPILLITAWFSSNASGQYSMAWKVLALPMALFGASIGQVFFQKFSEVWPDANAAEAVLIKTWKLLIIIGIIPTILIMIFGEHLFAFVLGDAWKDAGRMATFLAPMLLAILVSSPTSTTYLVLGMQKYSLIFGITSLIYRPLCLYLGWVNESLFFGLLLLVLAEVIQIVIYQYLAIKRIRRGV
jgi:O-antigen/teichoic acid export membrane protein